MTRRPQFPCQGCGRGRVWSKFALCARCQIDGAKKIAAAADAEPAHAGRVTSRRPNIEGTHDDIPY